jgi:hypothetical protein
MGFKKYHTPPFKMQTLEMILSYQESSKNRYTKSSMQENFKPT